MKQQVNIFILVLIFCLLYACSSDDGTEIKDEQVAVQLNAGNTAYAKTTSGGDQWLQNDKIGVFMKKNGQSLNTATIFEGVNNRLYQISDVVSGSLSPTDGDPVYYPQNEMVDFIAYYPFLTTVSDFTIPIDVTYQTDPAGIDLLYSNNATNKDKNSGTVTLSFGHALSKLEFTMSSGVGSPNIANAIVEITHLYCTADFSLEEGSINNLDSEGTIATNPQDQRKYSAIVIPQPTQNSKLIVKLIDGSIFEWEFPTTTNFEQGKIYPYNIRVDKTGIEVTINNITDWEGKDDAPIEGDTDSSKYFKVGDYYPDKNVDLHDVIEKAKIQGVVFWVNPSNKTHGKIVSLDEENLMWCDHLANNINAKNYEDGLANMKTIYDQTNGTFEDQIRDFPAFKWVHTIKNNSSTDYTSGSLGVWYLPAVAEMQYLYSKFCDKPFETWGDWTGSDNTGDIYPSWRGMETSYQKNAFNAKLTDAGGTKLRDITYWTSTEYSSGYSYNTSFGTGNLINGQTKDNAKGTRAIMAF